MNMRKIESTTKNVTSSPFTDKQRNEAIDEFEIYVENTKKAENEYESRTSIIEAFCSTNGISYNTFQKFLNKEKVSKKQELRIRSAIDIHFVGCHCHFIKEPEKTLPTVLTADHIILEARWLTTENVVELQGTLQKQTEIISELEKARKIGKKIIFPGLSTLESMKLNVALLQACKDLVDKLNEYQLSIHIGKVASFKQKEEEGISPNDVSYIVCVNSVPSERETLSPEDFSFIPDFKKSI